MYTDQDRVRGRAPLNKDLPQNPTQREAAQAGKSFSDRPRAFRICTPNTASGFAGYNDPTKKNQRFKNGELQQAVTMAVDQLLGQSR